MKLTVINNEVIFDYSEINMSTLITNPDHLKASQVREFLRNTACDWAFTDKPQVKRMVYSPDDYISPYLNAKRLNFLLNNCDINATYLKFIEITPEFEVYLLDTDVKCTKLREIELAKEKARERQAKWESLCKYGCGSCCNLCYNIDQPFCANTGEELREINSPAYSGNTLKLFNLVPMPTHSCPYSV